MKVALAPLRVPKGRLRREPPGQDMRVHGVDIVDGENDAHPIRRRRLIMAFARFRDPFTARNDVKAPVSPP